jgi:hypothetical protein
MRESRFEALLESYGAALERWPEAEREPARRLLAVSDAARAAHQRALALDAALDADRIAIDTATLDRLRGAIRARASLAAPTPPRRAGLARLLAAPGLRMAALAAAAVASIWIGWASASTPHPGLFAVLEGNSFVGARQ